MYISPVDDSPGEAADAGEAGGNEKNGQGGKQDTIEPIAPQKEGRHRDVAGLRLPENEHQTLMEGRKEDRDLLPICITDIGIGICRVIVSWRLVLECGPMLRDLLKRGQPPRGLAEAATELRVKHHPAVAGSGFHDNMSAETMPDFHLGDADIVAKGLQ